MGAINDYVGLELSVADLIGPLTELALRPAGSYNKENLVVLDLVRPRAGLWIAVPQFSRRLALTSGFAVRFLDVDRTDDGSSSSVTAEYRYHPSLMFDAGVQFVF